jgi:hypothetical protein
VTDPRDGTIEQVAGVLGSLRLSEAQRVEHGDRARTDGEHVAEDAADAGGGALEGLDGGGVVVRFDLEGDREAVADIDGAGVLTRAHEHVAAFGGEATEESLGMLVGAVL